MKTQLNKLYDIEDDVIDRGDATNLSEGLDYYQMEKFINPPPKRDKDLNQRIEDDYHNTYYNYKTKKFGGRTLKMKNKEWHKLNTLQNKEERDN